MDSQTPRSRIFEPTSRAFGDSWLQIRAKPAVYALIWLSLALAPYILLGLAFSKPVSAAFNAFLAQSEQLLTSGTTPDRLPPELMMPFLRLSLWNLALWMVMALVNIYMGAVLAGTISRFREKTFPKYLDAMGLGWTRYYGFLKAVLYAAFLILFRPLAVSIVGGLIGYFAASSAVPTVTFFISTFLFLSGLYKFGLGPFIHLSLKLSGRESCQLSRAFYISRRPVVSMLFLFVIILPALLLLFLFTLLMSSGAIFGVGSLIFWLIYSFLQFILMMTLVNFAMNTFEPEPDEIT